MQTHPLREWREKNGLTLEAFGNLIGVQRSAVSYYESGGRIPRPAIMERIRVATNGAISAKDFYPTGEAEAAE